MPVKCPFIKCIRADAIKIWESFREQKTEFIGLNCAFALLNAVEGSAFLLNSIALPYLPQFTINVFCYRQLQLFFFCSWRCLYFYIFIFISVLEISADGEILVIKWSVWSVKLTIQPHQSQENTGWKCLNKLIVFRNVMKKWMLTSHSCCCTSGIKKKWLKLAILVFKLLKKTISWIPETLNNEK